MRRTTISTPAPNWSHFDCFRRISAWTDALHYQPPRPPRAKSVVGVCWSSPRRKKPKNAVQAMAHRTTLSGSDDRDTAPWIRRSIGAVIVLFYASGREGIARAFQPTASHRICHSHKNTCRFTQYIHHNTCTPNRVIQQYACTYMICTLHMTIQVLHDNTHIA